MSRLIFSTHSSGVPATDSRSASSGENASIAPATSPLPSASTTGWTSLSAMSWRASCSSGIEEM